MDFNSHKCEELEGSKTIEMERECIREVFKSIGLTDKEGYFPYKTLYEESEKIYSENLSQRQMIEKQFKVFEDYYPEFVNCQNSAMSTLRELIGNRKELDIGRCVINRVFKKSDEKKEPIIYVYMERAGAEGEFFYADKNSKHFIGVNQEQFEEMFECYRMDLINSNEIRPWDKKEEKRVESTEINIDRENDNEGER